MLGDENGEMSTIPGLNQIQFKGFCGFMDRGLTEELYKLELEIERKSSIWAHVSRKQKISILVLSLAMGSNLREILENVCYPDFFLSFLIDKEKKLGQKKMSFWSGDSVFSESLCKELQNKFFQQKYELGRIGCRNMN
ncbi:RpoB [Gossypium australe]|uniref:DNA-directed RNA polymerase n=1 Tax=Gossypium australe TaxID=47621 RepID=A0A5B6UK23_9ROSI|nr:RpoB [Gossypium australe]